MSHIVNQKTKFAINNKNGIVSAIRMMEKEYPGIRIEEKGSMLLVRYAPIEVYQKQGNLRFIPTEDGRTFEMHYDYWNCNEVMQKVRDSFLVNYQKAGSIAFAQRRGFSVSQNTQKIDHGERLIAQKW